MVKYDTQEYSNEKLNIQLSNEIGQRRLPVQTTADWIKFLSTVFDSYMSNAMLPDYFLSCLIKKHLLCIFSCFHWNRTRRNIDRLICEDFYNTGLPSIDTLLVWSGDLFTYIKHISISGWFCVLLFVSHLFENYREASASNLATPFHLPELQQHFVALLYLYPLHKTNTASDFDYF